MSWLISLSSTSASQTKPLAGGCDSALPVLYHTRAAALTESSPIPDCQNVLLSLLGWVIKTLESETLVFSEIGADLQTGCPSVLLQWCCSSPHKDKGRDVWLNRGYFPT